jgi:ribosome modulation factor
MMKMRVVFLIAGLIVVSLYAGLEPASARGHSAWCARTNTGAGRVQENCGFKTIEACRRWVTGGNRGFCSPNPAYRKR